MTDTIPVYGIKPPTVSPYLTLPMRTPMQAFLERLAPPLWMIIWGPDATDAEIQMPLASARNERSALNFLRDQYRSGDVLVLNLTEDGRWVDCSEDFARAWAQDMRRQGWDAEYIQRAVPFIGKHLASYEIEEIR